MKSKVFIIIIAIIIALLHSTGFAQKKKVAQSGMTYLAISLGARESAMGNASVASVEGIQGLFYNQAVLAGFEGFGITMNQVNWLADTKVYGIGAAYGLSQFGTFGVDLVYMDYGKIVGTRRVDKSVDPRGFMITGDLNIQDYAVGLAYAYPVNDRFSFGVKFKYVHENLGNAPIAVKEIDVEKQLYEYENKAWKLCTQDYSAIPLEDMESEYINRKAAITHTISKIEVLDKKKSKKIERTVFKQFNAVFKWNKQQKPEI